MAFSIVDHIAAGSRNGDSVTTSAINTTGVNLIVVAESYYAAIDPEGTVSDSKGNSWNQLTLQNNSAAACRIWYSIPTSVGAGHTFSCSGTTGTGPAIEVLAVSSAAASPFDQQNGNVQGVGVLSIQPNSITPSEDNELLVTGLAWNDAAGAIIDSGFTISDQIPAATAQCVAGALAYLIQTTATAENPTWTIGSASIGTAIVIASFKAAAGGVSPSFVPNRQMIPVPGPRRSLIIPG